MMPGPVLAPSWAALAGQAGAEGEQPRSCPTMDARPVLDPRSGRGALPSPSGRLLGVEMGVGFWGYGRNPTNAGVLGVGSGYV